MNTQQRPAIDWYIYAHTITKQRNKLRDYIHTLSKEAVLPGGGASTGAPQPLCRRLEGIAERKTMCPERSAGQQGRGRGSR